MRTAGVRLAALCLFLFSSAAVAQRRPTIAERERARARAAEQQAIAFEAFSRRDAPAAEAALRKQIEFTPDDFVAHYNLASALAVQPGQQDQAIAALRRAIELGFSSKSSLTGDGWLAGLRTRDGYRAILDNWDSIMHAQREARLERDRALVPTAGDVISIEELRLDVLSSFAPAITAATVEELRRVASWAEHDLGIPAAGAALEEQAWVTVALPDKRGFNQWARLEYGVDALRGNAQIGGQYAHDDKRLVSRDLGATLRHEFFHVIHARDQERLGQRHATWILEGLASLLEDFDPIDTSPPSLTPAESRRSNIVRRMARINRIPPVEALAGLEAERFTRQRALAKYAQAHAVCLYLDRQGLLDDFYRLYTTDPADGYDADPTGLAALRAVLRTDDDGIDERLRLWARDELPEVPEEWTDADATIPVRVETDDDKGGVRVIQRRPPAGVNLRLGDVIVAMDGKPTPDFAEMLRHLIRAEPGQVVTLDIVRGKLTRQESVELIPTP